MEVNRVDIFIFTINMRGLTNTTHLLFSVISLIVSWISVHPTVTDNR